MHSPEMPATSERKSLQESNVLVVDDKRDVLTAIRLLLKEHVNLVHTTRNPATIPDLMVETEYDVVLLDMNFNQDASSGKEGFAWLERILELRPDVVVIMITAYGDIEKAVRAMKEGAADFITKPWDNERMLTAVDNAVRLRQTRMRAKTSEGEERVSVEVDDSFEGILGRSQPMQRVFSTIEKVAKTDANVLILGENGTGKELAARAIHEQSSRADASFEIVDLASLSESLFESELFGHVKGAFTGADASRPGRFEEADGGTLFLDEIGNVPRSLQAKLLTALQRREVIRVGSSEPRPVDIRLISATNEPIKEMVRTGSFRQDLLYRINTVEIELPPLRERGDDIAMLARHFCEVYAHRYERTASTLGEKAIRALHEYNWPGNVRELKHTIERAVILAEDDVIQPEDLSFSAPESQRATHTEELLSVDNLDLESIEQAAVRKALSKHGGNITKAAGELGISRKALYRRIEKYGL